MLYVGVPLLALGLMMMLRGWIYTLWPNGKIAERRKRRNLKVGFTTDMKLFGRKVRRIGLMVGIVGGGLVGWKLSMTPASTTTIVTQTLPNGLQLKTTTTTMTGAELNKMVDEAKAEAPPPAATPAPATP